MAPGPEEKTWTSLSAETLDQDLLTKFTISTKLNLFSVLQEARPESGSVSSSERCPDQLLRDSVTWEWRGDKVAASCGEHSGCQDKGELELMPDSGEMAAGSSVAPSAPDRWG